MNKKNVSRELRFQIREYLEFFWRQQNIGNAEQEQKIISQLAHNLKEKLFVEANKLILRDNKVFSNKFSERVLMKTLSIVKEYKYTPQQIIISRNQLDDQAIYFIENGTVEVFIENDTNQKIIQIQKLVKGSYFGELSFYTGQQRTLSVRSVDFATLLKIEREDFLNLLKSYPRDEELFYLIKDQVLFSKGYGPIGVSCFSCQSNEHLVGTCPIVQYVPNKFYCYKRFNYNPGQSRQTFQRILKEKYSTRKDLVLLKQAAENIQGDYEELMPETDSSLSALSCIEDANEEDEDDEEEFSRNTPRQKALIGDNLQSYQTWLSQYYRQSTSQNDNNDNINNKESRQKEGITKDTSPQSPNRRKALSSISQESSSASNAIIHEDSQESDSHHSNSNRLSIESKKNVNVSDDNSNNDNNNNHSDKKRIKFVQVESVHVNEENANQSQECSNDATNSYTIELSSRNSQVEPIVAKPMLSNQTVRQSAFSKNKPQFRRSSAIDLGQEFDDETQQNNGQQNSQITTPLQTKENVNNNKSYKPTITNLKSVKSSSLFARRYSQDKRTSLLSFSPQFVQQQKSKKEFPRIAQLRKDKITSIVSNSPKSSTLSYQQASNSGTNLYFNNNNNQTNNFNNNNQVNYPNQNDIQSNYLYSNNNNNNNNINSQINLNSPPLCGQCMCSFDQNAIYQTNKSMFKFTSEYNNQFKNENNYMNSPNQNLQFGSHLQMRPRNNSQNMSFNQNRSSISSLNYSNLNSPQNHPNSNRNSAVSISHLNLNSRRRSSISRMNIPLHQSQVDSLQNYNQQGMIMRSLKHKDSFSSSNSPKSRRHQSVNSNKYSKIELTYNQDQLFKKVNAIYDKLYTDASQEGSAYSLEFDKQKDFEIYFPKFNLSVVLKKRKDQKKTTQLNRFIQAFNISRGQSSLEESEFRKAASGQTINRSSSDIYNQNRKLSLSSQSPIRNRSARSSIFIPQSGQIGQTIRGLKVRPSLNQDGQWEIKSATFPKKEYF